MKKFSKVLLSSIVLVTSITAFGFLTATFGNKVSAEVDPNTIDVTTWTPNEVNLTISKVDEDTYTVKSTFKWNDVSGFQGVHTRYEHEIIFKEWDLFECKHTYSTNILYTIMRLAVGTGQFPGFQTRLDEAYKDSSIDCYYNPLLPSSWQGIYTNLDYVDTRFLDKEADGKAFTVGLLNKPEVDKDYYVIFTVKRKGQIKASNLEVSSSLGHVNNAYETPGDLSKTNQNIFCNLAPYRTDMQRGAACTFKSLTVENPIHIQEKLDLDDLDTSNDIVFTWPTSDTPSDSVCTEVGLFCGDNIDNNLAKEALYSCTNIGSTPQYVNICSTECIRQSSVSDDYCAANTFQGNNATFISDVTIPDNTQIGPNQTFLKTWRVQNTGTTTWDTNYRLAFQYGSRMGGAYSVGIPHSVAPGETVDVSVTLTSPTNIGSYRGYWQLQDASGTNFGHILWVDIKVENNAPLPSSLETVKLYTQANYGGSISFENGKGEFSGLTPDTYSLKLPDNWSVVTYKENDFGGNETRCWYESEDNLQDHSWHNSIKSVKIYNYNYCSGNQRVKLYSLSNYGGSLVNELNLGENNAPDKNTFSMKIPTGWSVKTWDQNDKKGRSRCWNESVANLQDHESWHLAIDSAEVFPTDTCPNTDSFVKLCKDTGAHEGANCTTIESDIASLGNWGFGNDVAKSIWIAGPWEVELYKDDNFQGDKYLYRDSSNDIRNQPPDTANPNNGYGASSIKVRRYNPAYVTMYRLGDYNDGGPFKTDRTLDNLDSWGFNDKANSISIASGYEVIACEHANFKGVCGRLKGDDPNAHDWGKSVTFPGLGSYLQGKISSLVVCKDECGETPENYNLLTPLNSSSYIPGNEIEFEWSGEGEEFKVEILGGEFGGTVGAHSGWITDNTWSYSDLEPSETPYRWRVTGWNEFGTGATSAEYSFMVEDIPIEELYIIGDEFVSLHSDLQLLGLVNPTDASNIEISWSPEPNAGQGTLAPTFNWGEIGNKTVTLTVENSRGSVHKTFDVEVGCTEGEYLAEYFDNKTLTGDPISTRCESTIDYNWGSFLPGSMSEFGTGKDGDLTVGFGQTVYTDDIRSKVTTTVSSNQNIISVENANQFVPGDEILIIQISGTGAGQYEFAKIETRQGNDIETKSPLQNTYTINTLSNVQVVNVPHYRDVIVEGTLTAHDWDNNVGGIVAFRSNGTVKVTGGGKIDVTGLGFAGGNGGDLSNGYTDTGDTGASYSNPHTISGPTGPNCGACTSPAGPANGGAGKGGRGQRGGDGASGGAGGSYGTVGAAGQAAQVSPHSAGGGIGSTYGVTDLSTIFFGSGGGGGGKGNNGKGNKGGDGGGIIMIFAKQINVNGNIAADGNAASNNYSQGGGGGGAGGSIYIKTSEFTSLDNKVTAKGGSYFDVPSGIGRGGIGGQGRLRFEYCSNLSVISIPNASTSQTSCDDSEFSIRWTTVQDFTFPDYNISLLSDDGVRVWIDDQIIYDEWTDGSHSTTINDSATIGQHEVKVEYYENTGDAHIVFNLDALGPNEIPVVTDIHNQVIDINNSFTAIDLNNFGSDADTSDTLTWSVSGNADLTVDIDQNNVATVTTPQDWSGSEEITFTLTDQRGASDSDPVTFQRYPCATGEYHAEYFDNKTLTGEPLATQCETEINYDWETNSPISSLETGGGTQDLIVNQNTTLSVIDSVANGAVGTNNLRAQNTSFASGQKILIHQTRGTSTPGVYEINEIASYDNDTGTITTVNPLTNTYVADMSAYDTAERAQVLVIPEYRDVTVNSGVTLSPKAWSSTSGVGGILIFFANGDVDIQGTIDASGLGYFSRGAGTGAGNPGGKGEGHIGYPGATYTNNGSGAGGGTSGGSIAGSGGGGSHKTTGTKGSNGNGNPAQGGAAGTTIGSDDLSTIFFGGAGGSGGYKCCWHQGKKGGFGGGIVFIQAESIHIDGNILSKGNNGLSSNSSSGSGGAGAGGTVYLSATSLDYSGQINVSGGSGGVGVGTSGGNGGAGRIRIDACSQEDLDEFTTLTAYKVNTDCVESDDFSVRWTGIQNFNYDGYTAQIDADDGIKVWIDDQIIYDEWTDGSHSTTINDSATIGQHEVKVEYYEHTGDAYVQFNLASEPPNEIPVVTDIHNQVIDINNSFTAIDLNNFGSDADVDDTLTWSFDGNTDLTVDIDQNNVATVTAPQDWSGSEEITFTLTDQRGASDSDPVTFQRYPCATGEYHAEYFDNKTLTGDPTFTQCASAIDHDWGTSDPFNSDVNLDFDGIDDYAVIPDNSVFDLDTMTVEAWVYPEGTQSSFQPILVKEGDAGENVNYAFFIRPNNMIIHFAMQMSDCSTYAYMNSANEIPLNEWSHVAASYDGSNIRIYINGNLENTKPYSITPCKNDYDIHFGRVINNYSPLNGKLSDVRLWDHARSQSEISGNLSTSLIGNENGLLGNWRLNEGTDQVINDVTGNHHGFIGATNASESSDPTWDQDTSRSQSFSIRWTGIQDFAFSEYDLTLTSDDGVRVWLDDQMIIDEWTDGSHSTTINDSATIGQHEVKVEYYENTGDAHIVFNLDALGPNEIPVVTDIHNQVIDINNSFTAIDLNNFGSDADVDDTLTWSFDGNTDLTVDIDQNNVATVTAPQDWSGSEEITFTLTDQRGASDSDPVTFQRYPCATGEYHAEYFNNKTLTGDPTFTQCASAIDHDWGTSDPFNSDVNLDFDGIDDYAVIPDNSVFDLDTMTVEAWVYPEGTQSSFQPILVKEGDAGENVNYAFFIRPNNMIIHFAMQMSDCSTYAYMNSANEIPLNEWSHVAASYDGSNIRIYINGNLENTKPYSITPCKNDYDIHFGRVINNYSPLNGKLSDVRLWDHARSQSEISGNLSTSLIGNENGLLGNWRLNEGTDQVINDVTGNHHGFIGATNASESSDPTWDQDTSRSQSFSVRWTGILDFANDSYTISATADDGIRGWIDGQQIFDEWTDGVHTISESENIADFAGVHEVVIEYYENTGDAEVSIDII